MLEIVVGGHYTVFEIILLLVTDPCLGDDAH